MYNIEDRVSAIKAIQGLIGVKETGVFNEETTAVIKNLQKNYGLKATGIVDYLTHNAIVHEFNIRKNQSNRC